MGLMLWRMMFVAPRSAICRWASSPAPSAIASMALTDETPKINPSAVNSTRSSCNVTLRAASLIVLQSYYMTVGDDFHVESLRLCQRPRGIHAYGAAPGGPAFFAL